MFFLLMEKIQDRKDIENPDWIHNECFKGFTKRMRWEEPLSQDQMILPYLISYFKKSNETMPDWFIEKSNGRITKCTMR